MARAIVGSIAGWLLLSVGIGIGAPRWGQGMPVAVVLSAVALACGVALLVLAGAALIRATRGWGRLVLAPWVVVVLVLTYALSIAFAAAFPPHPGLDEATPAGAEVVEMTATDGVDARGLVLPDPHRRRRRRPARCRLDARGRARPRPRCSWTPATECW